MGIKKGRPIRAFLFTPIFFILLFAVPLWLRINFETPADGIFEFASQSLNYFSIILLFGLPIAYMGALIGGLPVYLLVRNSKFESAVTCVITTAIIASLVFFLLEVDIFPPEKGSSYSHGDSGGQIIIDNKRTSYGWRKLFLGMSQVFILGTISGVMFWRLHSGKWCGRIID